jgi:hypothetical protein
MSDNSMFDKIVEFGMGMTVARQIPQMMDVAMSQVNQPTANTPPEIKADVANVFIANNNQQAGPFSDAEIKQLISNGVLTQNTLVWMPKMPQWMPASQVPAINKLFLLASMATTPSVPAAPQTTTPPIPQEPIISSIREEVVAAIAQLGYSNANARKIIDDVLASNPGISTSDAIKEVLKKF